MGLYERMRHDGTDEQVWNTLRAWKDGDVSPGTYQFSPHYVVATAEATCALPGDKQIFKKVYFAKATIVGIKPDGRLECLGKPIQDPDPKYANPKIQREFRFYLLIAPGTLLVPDNGNNQSNNCTSRHLRAV